VRDYLRVKIRTAHPGRVLERLRAAGLSPLAETFFPDTGLLVLGYPAEGVHERLRALARTLPGVEIEETELAESPRPVPRRFRVGPFRFFSPLGVERPEPGEIYLRANLSFGSGSHPTTVLCLRALSLLCEDGPPGRVLDLGCGSGILALAAARLGAERVLAVDIDPRACREALHNVETNGLSGRILVIRGSAEVARRGRFDLVLANLTIGTILALAPEIRKALRPGGRAVLSGFSVAQAPEVLRRLTGARVFSRLTLEGWLALVLGF